ncbi:hypothetical protein ABBQ32_006274 [Trebouxia sp. C0010 RCD-2024]
MADFGRIQKELKEIDRDKASGVTVEVSDGNLQKLTGFVEGPKDTAYEGGYFVVDIVLDNQYPFVPPKMRFVTKVWHPNVSSANGAICLDILKDQWSPALTLKTALLSLQALLSSPEPADPQDAVVAKQYMRQNKDFQRQAKEWTQTYAVKPSASDSRVQQLVDMGFPYDTVSRALLAAGGDQNAALERLLG